jgi:hypothetical protein
MRTRSYGELVFMLLGLSLAACAADDGGGSGDDAEPPAPRRDGGGLLGDLGDLPPTPDAALPTDDAAP